MNQPRTEHYVGYDRWYGISVPVALVTLGLLVQRITGFQHSLLISGIVASVYAGVFYTIPKSQASLIRTFHVLTFPIRWCMVLFSLAILYYLVVAPIAVWFRLSGRSFRNSRKHACSNWHSIAHHQDEPARPADESDVQTAPTEIESYFRTY